MYNTFTGVFGVMNKNAQTLFGNIENTDVENLTDDNTQKIISIMSRSGFIVSVDRDELAIIKLERMKRRLNENALSLTIAPTLNCNMCCPYCFEDKNEMVMSSETQAQLITFVEAHLKVHPNIKELFVTWYGVEPLMQKEIIYNLSKKMIGICKEKNVKYSATMISNGVLLDVETARRLARDCKVRQVQITIDGLKDTHNQRRILSDRGDSYSIIMENIDACKDYINISVRVNVDKSSLQSLCEILKEIKYNKIIIVVTHEQLIIDASDHVIKLG